MVVSGDVFRYRFACGTECDGADNADDFQKI
jgi:hypothetical protein